MKINKKFNQNNNNKILNRSSKNKNKIDIPPFNN